MRSHPTHPLSYVSVYCKECPFLLIQKQPPRGTTWKRCSENMQQIYRRTPMSKCDFNKVALQDWKMLCNFIEIALRHGCSPANLLHIFRTTFPKNTSERLLLLILLILSKSCTAKFQYYLYFL